MAGWASANKYALLGGLRAAAQLVSYELPIVLAVASIALAGGSLSLATLTDRWSPWWLLWQLPGALVFLVAACAELQRPPFDMPVADAELVMGAWTEYTGLRFAFFLLAEYAGIVVVSLLLATLWLGGWHGPFADELGWLWTLLKGWRWPWSSSGSASRGPGCGRTSCNGSPGSGSSRSPSASCC